ncbi:MAG: glycosyltransferase [Myxococcota bacterium]
MDGATALVVAYIALHALLCVHGLHRGWLQLMVWRSAPEPVPPVPTVWPRVTVQLPVFNERNVVQRIIEVTGRLDYPADLLEIQVLDDSTDDTTDLAQLACDRLRSQGIDASVVHRTDRTGFKSGALAEGLAGAKADRIAIFDADFMPPADFLKRTVPYLEQGVGMVQARWDHLNDTAHLHTLLQAMLLDGHFNVEQVARYRGRRWLQFNGTAGIWRRDTIEKAGGWEHDTLTEDLDLSYRAQIVGERFVFLDDLVAPAELPSSMAAFKAQQHRWGKGMVQAAKKSLGRIWASKAKFLLKVEATLHLTSVFAWPLVAVVSVLLPVGVWAREADLLQIPWAVDLALFATATCTIFSFYVLAAIRAQRPHLALRLFLVPMAMGLGVGLAIAQTRAAWEGLFGEVGVFVRTPKAGDAATSSYRAKVDPVVVIELLMTVWLGGTAVWGALSGWIGAVPFLALFALGYGIISVQTSVEAAQRFRASKPASTPTASKAGAQVTAHSHGGSDQAPVAASYPESTP